MATISTIVDDVLHTRTLTMAQRRELSDLLKSSQCSDKDATAMLLLIDALSNNNVLAAIPI